MQRPQVELLGLHFHKFAKNFLIELLSFTSSRYVLYLSNLTLVSEKVYHRVCHVGTLNISST